MAVSALRSSDSAVARRGPGTVTAIPMLALIACSKPSISTGSTNVSSKWSANTHASEESRMSAQMMTNSSPPKRATLSDLRHELESRLATSRSTWSPTWWPKRSFTTLNRSRSRKNRASERPVRWLMARLCSRRSSSSARFNRPVSGSYMAWYALIRVRRSTRLRFWFRSRRRVNTLATLCSSCCGATGLIR